VTATRAEVVLDASAAVRIVLGLAPDVRGLFADRRVSAPDLLALEAANALAAYARRGDLAPALAVGMLGDLLALPLELVPARGLAAPAQEAAIQLGLTVYDAAYVVLAASIDATLVTADRRLAASHERSEPWS
jgi:predicted nucleic acid-binding protein